jgi:hypothetical protein
MPQQCLLHVEIRSRLGKKLVRNFRQSHNAQDTKDTLTRARERFLVGYEEAGLVLEASWWQSQMHGPPKIALDFEPLGRLPVLRLSLLLLRLLRPCVAAVRRNKLRLGDRLLGGFTHRRRLNRWLSRLLRLP